MNTIETYLIGLGLTLIATGAVVVCLRRSLRRILLDLCGTEPRGDFWTAFSVVLLILVPLIFAMIQPVGGRESPGAFFDIALQLKLALIGLVVALVILGIFLCVFAFASPSTQ
jgi:hypothetical protein